jgi:membrane-associated phospholipid phosphatase
MRRPWTLASSLALAALVVYAGMWVGYRQDWGWLHSVDWSLLNAAHGIAVKHPVWARFWRVVSFALGPVPLRLLGIALVVVLVRRSVRAAALVLVCVPLNGFVTVAAKGLANRPRPVTALVSEPSTSFPSGHALEATVSALALLTVAWPLMSRSIRRIAVAVAALSVLTVGLARIALNVHYPSDVLAGWALGYVYFLVALWVCRPPTARRPPDIAA